ncbi:MAG: hypothetical protein K6B40_05305 [Firmicutes bacterium]|nr:hypothetical protein [Bacillota bacterium]
MAISKLVFDGVTQMDLTGDTVAADKLLDDYTAHGADGEPVTGTYVAPAPTLLATATYTVNTSSTQLLLAVLIAVLPLLLPTK